MDPYLQIQPSATRCEQQNVQQLSNCPVNSLWFVVQNEWWLTPKQKLHSFQYLIWVAKFVVLDTLQFGSPTRRSHFSNRSQVPNEPDSNETKPEFIQIQATTTTTVTCDSRNEDMKVSLRESDNLGDSSQESEYM